MINSSWLDIEEELMKLCTGGSTVDTGGGGSSTEVESDVEVMIL